MIAKHALTRLEWLGGDSFCDWLINHSYRLNRCFIIFPSVAIFIPMFQDSAGNFAPFEFIAILSQAHIVQVMINSILLSIAVGIGCTFFFWFDLAIYTSRIAVRSAIIGRVFSILPIIVTPPLLFVGLGVTLMMGRSGYITEFLATYAGLENTNWLYGFCGNLACTSTCLYLCLL